MKPNPRKTRLERGWLREPVLRARAGQRQKRYLLNGWQRLEDRRMLAVATSAGTGLLAQYYDDDQLGTLEFTAVESETSFDWADGSPDAALNADGFSVRFSGEVEPEFTETYTFTLSAEGGVRLWVNGIKLVDRWTNSNVLDASGSIDLIAGRKYDLQLEFREESGDASLDLSWSSASLSDQAIPSENLFPSRRGSIQRRVWNGLLGAAVSDLTGVSTYPNQPSGSEFISSLSVPDSGASDFGDLLAGYLHPPESGDYEFFVSGDATAELWLSDGADASGLRQIAFSQNQTTPYDWTEQASQRSGSISLVAGQSYAIEVIRKEDTGDDHVAVGWMHAGNNSIEVIDGQYLSPRVPRVDVFSETPDVYEGDSTPISFRIQRDGPTDQPLDVKYLLRGSATASQDYNAVSGTVTIAAGASSESVTVAALTDTLFEGPETVVLELIADTGYSLGYRSQRQSTAVIQDVSQELPGGAIISPSFGLNDIIQFGAAFSQLASPPAPYSQVIEADVLPTTNPWDAQIRAVYTGDVNVGDILWADMFVRAIGEEGQISVVSEQTSAPYSKSLDETLSVPTDWTRLQIPFESNGTYLAGEAAFAFFLGHQAQTIQIADLRVLHYGPQSTLTPSFLQLQNLGGTFGNFSTIAVSGQSFETATRIETQVTPTDSWRLQYGGRNASAVREGDTLRYSLYARSVSGISPQAQLVIQNTDNFAPVFVQTFFPDASWTHYQFEVTLDANGPGYGVGGLQAMLNLGFDPQVIEIAEIDWQNLSAAGDLPDYPSLKPSVSYVGRESDATWREGAAAGIDANRKSNLTVEVVDANGFPVDGAVVSIRQISHDFLFGTAVSAFNNLLSPFGGVVADRYQSEVARLFNAVTIENALKWPEYASDSQRGIDAAQWAIDNDLHLRGHNVLWPSRDLMPTYVWDEYDDRLANQGSIAAEDYLRTEIENRIETVITQFKDQVIEWDIVNEPFDNNDAINVLGDQIVVDWFTQAKVWDPDIIRTLNDFNIFVRNGQDTTHRANFEYWLGLLTAANAVEVIGVQNHYSEANLTDIVALESLIDAYDTQFGLPIAVTEFDIASTDRQLQADYLRDYATMLFSKEAINQFVQWGFWADRHPRPEAALLDSDFSTRPHGQVYEDLVFGDWWTDERATTQDGQVQRRVFRGDYELTVSIGNQRVVTTLSDFSADATTTIALPGVEWSQTDLSGAEGASMNLHAVLSKPPEEEVVATLLASDQLAISPSQLTFTPENWDTPQLVSITPVEDYTVEGAQVEYVSAIASSLDLAFNDAAASAVSVSFGDGLAPLGISDLIVGDGTQQRSMLRELRIEFDGLADVQPDAISVQRLNENGIDDSVDTNFTSQDLEGRTELVVQFSGVWVSPTTGSLLDGDYRLQVDPNGVTLRGTSAILDGDGSGAPGGGLVYGGSAISDDFFALFGDADGDGSVGLLDFAAFRQTFGAVSGDADYLESLDSDLDGMIGLLDFAAMRGQFGASR